MSKKRAVALRIYAKKRLEFLEANPACGRCGMRATQIHHKAGRDGARLLDESRWVGLCAFCHGLLTQNPQQAIEEGFSLPRIGRSA